MMAARDRTKLLATIVGLAAMLVATGAMAANGKNERGDRDRERGRDQKQVREQAPAEQSARQGRTRPRVLINGSEDEDLSRRAVKVGPSVMVPSDSLFRSVGGDVRRERGWIPPGSRDRDRDRDRDWYVVRRGGRDLRFRPNERLYYYGGVPHYFSTAPYESGGSLFLALADIAGLFGGRYDYDDRYYDGRVTMCEGGYCPTGNELRLTYPYPGQYIGSRGFMVQGYAPPYLPVRVDILSDEPYVFANPHVYSTTTRADRNGVFAARVSVPGYGTYRADIALLDEYGRVVNQDTAQFFVR